MKEYKTFKEAYKLYISNKRDYIYLCIFLRHSPTLLQQFKQYYDPNLYSKLVVETDQVNKVFMRTIEEFHSPYPYTQKEIDRRATALAFLAAMEESGDL